MNPSRSGALIHWLIAIGVILAYMAPHFLKGEDSYVLIHDNLDQPPIATATAWKTSGKFFGANEDPIFPIMNGLPRGVLVAELGFSSICYWLLSPYTAFVVIQTTGRFIALVGMWLLLGVLFRGTDARQTQEIRIAVSLCFSLLPHYPPAGLTVSMMPLAAWALIQIACERGRWIHWLAITAYPFCSSFLAAPIFLYVLAGLGWVVLICRSMVEDRRFCLHGRLLGVLAWVSILGLICEYRLLTMTFFSDYVSHRTEFRQAPLGIIPSLRLGFENLINGQYHVHTYQYPILWILLLVSLVWMEVGRGFSYFAVKRIRRSWRSSGRARNDLISKSETCLKPVRTANSGSDRLWLVALLFFFVTAAISLIYGMNFSGYFRDLLERTGPLKMINWGRFHWLHPMLWYVIVGLAAAALACHWRPLKWFCLAVIFVQIGFLYIHSDHAIHRRRGLPTYSQFFAVEQFEAIRNFIGRDPSDYRVASLGIHPSVAAYNGFYCLDAYLFNYPLEYKHAFRHIIAPELEKNEQIRNYFNHWGSRCYLYSSELGKLRNGMRTKDHAPVLSRLDLNMEAFKSMGGSYIFSACQIDRPQSSGLRYLGSFEHPVSAWCIWLYEAI